MLIGAHESIAGGFDRSVQRALEDECDAFQIFTGAPGRWVVPPVDPGAALAFKVVRSSNGAMPVVAHGAYLINPASPDPHLWARSLLALREEFARCLALGIDCLVIHPGSHRSTSAKDGILRAGEMLGTVLEEEGGGVEILLENTAGSGSSLGSTFDQLAAIREAAGLSNRVRLCLDTAHAFAAGYDLRDLKRVKASMRRIDGEAGLENVGCVHLNDSTKELGSRVDRHERIGKGWIGEKGFSAILGQVRFSGIPGILETQPEPDRAGRYLSQVRLLKKLAGKAP